MQLSAVHYGLFSYERDHGDENNQLSWHQLDGEIRLCFSDAPDAFVSWGNGPPQHAVAMRSGSFFNPDTLEYSEMSAHPFWESLVGSEVTVTQTEPEYQMLRIANTSTAVSLTSQSEDGSYMSDCIRVSPADAT